MIDTTLFDKKLADLIDRHQDLVGAEQEALQARTRADEAVRDAEAADMAEVAASRVAGKDDDPEPGRTVEAKRVAELAEREVEVTRAAVAQSLVVVADEAREPSHAGAVEKLIAAQEQTSKNLVAQLEAALVRLQEGKAALRWLERPVDAGRTTTLHTRDLFVTVESLKRPNGEYPSALDLTRAVHEALLPEDARQKAARFPGGFPGEWEYSGASLGHDPRPVNKRGQPNETGAARVMAEQIAALDD